MSVEEFKKIDAAEIPIVKLFAIIAKNQTVYLNRHLEEFNINSSQLHFLFEISHQKEINQENIASRCSINKGAVARSIKKLEDNGLVKRRIDDNNRRQNIISLTPKGEEILKKAIAKLDKWESYVFEDNIIDKEMMQISLKEIAIKSMEFNHKEE
ncbi:MAG: MarR family transcriptional regulator [Methanobrevibacter sp.]|nr:MarR family transcriptional regulator [Methanobrevibacter sp.]MEE3490182.1 MarR family transcriptional regulator [Methanobrevibacter sp.]